ncbi:hypothetical protein L6164_034908 [Bauhinia variegata]|uniref:Uncharacterized protein n=1 Tax=Bauhinia variegata TaxID=167791 RepID=A0ACB9KWJ8_BAUVA|nr:hypothetical protein L6164_034908 [Bauhinia variegata]
MVLYMPRSPKFDIVSLRVSPITIDNTALVSTAWNVAFFARNPNKRLTVKYNYVQVSLYYNWINVSSKRIGVFSQPPEHGNFVHATTSVQPNRVSMLDLDSVVDNVHDFALNFDVKLRGSVMVYVSSTMGINHGLSIDCENVEVRFSPQNGTGLMLGKSKRCHNNKFIF